MYSDFDDDQLVFVDVELTFFVAVLTTLLHYGVSV